MTKAIRQDRIIIFLCPIIAAIISYFVFKGLFGKYNIIISSTDGLDDCKLMLDIWGTLLGFLITAVSLFLTIGDGKYMNTLKSSGHFTTVLYSYVICCIHLFFCSHICADSYFYKNMEYDGIYNIVCSSG